MRQIAQLSLGILLLGFLGCAQNVLVHHYSIPNQLTQEQSSRTSRMYLIAEVPPMDNPEKSSLEKALDLIGAFLPKKTKESYDHALTRQELRQISKNLTEIIQNSGNQVVGYQIGYSTETIPWMNDFSPTSSLWISPSDMSVKQEEEETTEKTDQGEKKVKKYKIKVNYSLNWALHTEPEKNILAIGKYPAYGEILEEERDSQVEDLEEYLKPKFWDLIAKGLKKLDEDILPHEVERWRSISKSNGEMGTAYDYIQKQEWEKAAQIWKELSEREPSNWEPYYTLGIYHERNQEWSQARESYKNALARSKDESKQKKISKILEELGRLTSTSVIAKEKPSRFYEGDIAVLPLKNESVDLSGGDYIRYKLNEQLAKKGYHLTSIPESDQKLKEKGILEGGQLNLLTPQALCKLLGANRLLYGTIQEFRVVNIGIFYKRQVKLALQLYDSQGHLLWKNTAQKIRQDGIRPQEAPQTFLINLATTQIEKIAKTYLKEESDEAIQRVLETLPEKIGRP